jgi:hypothetical protein
MEGDKPSARDGWIDVHAHYLPPVYLDALRDAGVTKLDGGIPIPRWNPEDSLGMMDRCHTATQILSRHRQACSLFGATRRYGSRVR